MLDVENSPGIRLQRVDNSVRVKIKAFSRVVNSVLTCTSSKRSATAKATTVLREQVVRDACRGSLIQDHVKKGTLGFPLAYLRRSIIECWS